MKERNEYRARLSIDQILMSKVLYSLEQTKCCEKLLVANLYVPLTHTLSVCQVSSPAQVVTHPELSRKLTHKWVLGEGGDTEGAFKVSLKRARRGGFCYQWSIELTTLQPARPPTKTNMCLWEMDMGDTSVLKSTFLKVTETEAAISHLQYFIRTHTHTQLRDKIMLIFSARGTVGYVYRHLNLHRCVSQIKHLGNKNVHLWNNACQKKKYD